MYYLKSTSREAASIHLCTTLNGRVTRADGRRASAHLGSRGLVVTGGRFLYRLLYPFLGGNIILYTKPLKVSMLGAFVMLGGVWFLI